MVVIVTYCPKAERNEKDYVVGQGAACLQRNCKTCSQRFVCKTTCPVNDRILVVVDSEREFNKLTGRYRIRRKRKSRWSVNTRWFVAFTDYIRW